MSLLKPVYMKNSELPINKPNRISDFDIMEAVSSTVGDKIRCIQLDRDLWRIYLMDNDSKQKLLLEGFELNGQTISVFEFNPYSSGASSPSEKVLKVTVSGIRYPWMTRKLCVCWKSLT